jgi:hypothetical protein
MNSLTNNKSTVTQTTMAEPSGASRYRRHLSDPVIAAFIAGGVAGAVSRTVVSPLERLKILFQVQSVGRNEYQMSVPRALAKMWREEGIRGFMAGNGTNCIRIVPYSAVQFGAYNLYKPVSPNVTPCMRHLQPTRQARRINSGILNLSQVL